MTANDMDMRMLVRDWSIVIHISEHAIFGQPSNDVPGGPSFISDPRGEDAPEWQHASTKPIAFLASHLMSS